MELEHDIQLSAGKRSQLHRHCQDILKPRLHEVSQMKVEKRKIALNLFRDLEVITFEKSKLLFQSRNLQVRIHNLSQDLSMKTKWLNKLNEEEYMMRQAMTEKRNDSQKGIVDNPPLVDLVSDSEDSND